MPLAALTAHQAIERSGLRGGETFFVPGGAGGVGHFAIQLARGARRARDRLRLARQPRLPARARRRARRLHATTTSPRRCASSPAATAPTRRWTSSAATRARRCSRACAAAGGCLARLARPEPREGYEVHYIFVRPSGYDLGEHITPLVHEGRLRPHVEEVFPLERAAEAHERLEDGHVRGKLVLTIPLDGGRRAALARLRRARAPLRAPGRAAAAARSPAARSPPTELEPRSRRRGAPRRGRRCGRSGPSRSATGRSTISTIASADRAERPRAPARPGASRPPNAAVAHRQRGEADHRQRVAVVSARRVVVPPSGTTVTALISRSVRNSATISATTASAEQHERPVAHDGGGDGGRRAGDGERAGHGRSLRPAGRVTQGAAFSSAPCGDLALDAHTWSAAGATLRVSTTSWPDPSGVVEELAVRGEHDDAVGPRPPPRSNRRWCSARRRGRALDVRVAVAHVAAAGGQLRMTSRLGDSRVSATSAL